jgi:hypothetical protein
MPCGALGLPLHPLLYYLQPHTLCPTCPSTLATHQGTGEDDDDVEASSASLVQSEEGYAPVFFTPRPLKNLVLVDEMPSLMPLTGGLRGWGTTQNGSCTIPPCNILKCNHVFANLQHLTSCCCCCCPPASFTVCRRHEGGQPA